MTITTASRIDPSIKYKENRGIEDADQGHDSSIYITTLFEDTKPIDVAIAVGKYKFAGEKSKVVYFPIYILSNNRIKAQIGVYETTVNKLPALMDEDGDVDIDALGEPVLYTFATEGFIRRCNSDPDHYAALPSIEEKRSDSDKQSDSDSDSDKHSVSDSEDEDFMQTTSSTQKLKNGSDIFKQVAEPETIVPLLEESEDDDIQIRAKYKPSGSNTWVQKFLRNDNYAIQETVRNGDCLFDAIRLAFRSVGKETTNAKLRQVVSERYTDSMFQTRKKYHDDIIREMRELTDKIDAVKTDIDAKKKKQHLIPEVSANHAEYESRTTKLKEHLDKQELLLKEYKTQLTSLRQLQTETVGNVNPQTMRSLENFRRFIMTHDYYADEAAIQILEEFLNIKLIPFDEAAYREKAVDAVVRPDAFLTENPILCTQVDEDFNPEYYILVSNSNIHYKLIEYKDRGAFKFHEIPYRVKILLVNKCMESNGAGYYNIQDFRNFKSLLGLSPDLGKPSEPHIPVYVETNANPFTCPNTNTACTITMPKFAETAVFAYNGASADAPRPGKGVNEHISATRVTEFNGLKQIANWRRKLSDEWTEAAFRLDGHMWASVEHYVLGSQFKHAEPSFFAKFSLDADTQTSSPKSVGRDVDAARKLADKPPHGIKPDVTYNAEAKQRFRREALQKKFEQPDMRQLLAATKNAKLLIFKRRNEPMMDIDLMLLRGTLGVPVA
jgi:predicted NAD-dependent protein-ADP-ribosyltransferase YbiA (DUF1768 family)